MNGLRRWALTGALLALVGVAGAGTGTTPPGDWSAGADDLVAVYAAASAVVDGKLYVFGGKDGFPFGSTMYADLNDNGTYDAGIDTLLTEGRPAEILDGVLISYFSNVRIYNPASDSWTAGTPMPTPRAHATAVVVDGLIYVIGGAAGFSTFYSIVEIYDPATDSWTSGDSMPTARDAAAAAYLDGKIYVIGGRQSQYTAWISTVEVYDIAGESWSTGPSLPQPIRDASAFVSGAKIYVPGGYVGGGAATASVHVLDTGTGAWTSGPSMPAAVEGYGGGIIDGTLLRRRWSEHRRRRA